nr:uncharacterized protein LOC127340492 [Lolium perenne]
MKNWLHYPKDDKESIRVAGFIDTNKEETNLCAEDLVRAFLARRVLPLQRRAHKISQMSGPMDPTRIKTHRLSSTDLVLKAKQIFQNPLSPSGKYGLAPYSRSNSPPRRVRLRDLRKAFTDLRSARANPQVVERTVPLQAEVGQEFLDNLASRGQKNKAPAPEAGSSEAPPAERSRKDGGKPYTKKRYRSQIPVATGLTRSATGMRPETSEDAARASPPPQAKEDSSSPPEAKDTGTSNIGAGTEEPERAEPPVPPTPKKKKKASASPSRTMPEASAPATSSPAKETPEAPAPTPPAALSGKPAGGKPSKPEGAKLTAQQLAAVVTAATSPSSGSQTLVLYAGRAAVVASEKASAQLGRITELNRGEADLSPATRGLGKDKLPVIDPFGPPSTVQHLSRLRRAVKEFDTAWHDASGNVVGTLDTRKQLFEELLWEHRYLSEAHSKCQAALPEASFEDLTAQLSALKAEKEQLALEHRKALDAQESLSAGLKDQLMRAELRHSRELKEAQAAAEAKLDESLKDLSNASTQLWKE